MSYYSRLLPFTKTEPKIDCKLLGFQSSNAATSIYTFSAFNSGGNSLGSETVNKQIVVMVYSGASVSASQVSCTIGGTAATSIASQFDATVTNTRLHCYILETASTSGNIVVTLSTVGINCSIAVYELINAKTTPYNTVATRGGGPNYTASINKLRNGCVIAAMSSYHASSAITYTWNNLVEDAENSAVGVTSSFASEKATTVTETFNISVTTNLVASTANYDMILGVAFEPKV